MAPLVKEFILALDIGGLTSYRAESCDRNKKLFSDKNFIDVEGRAIVETRAWGGTDREGFPRRIRVAESALGVLFTFCQKLQISRIFDELTTATYFRVCSSSGRLRRIYLRRNGSVFLVEAQREEGGFSHGRR